MRRFGCYLKREGGARTLLLLLALWLGAAWQFAAHAQAPATQRYPWDHRPTKCFAPDAPALGDCKLDNWPHFYVAAQRIAILYFNGQYQLLERALAEVVALEKRFPSGHSPELAIYEAFRRMIPGGIVDPGEREGRIARWRAAVPDSRYTAFAEARFLYAYAWNARGSGYAASVAKESWELFAIRLQEAEQALFKVQHLKDSPLWHNLLLAIASDSRSVRSDPKAVFEHAVRRWPSHYNFYTVMLSRMLAQWGGSWQEIEAFIRKWSDEQAPSEGRSLYARLYGEVLGMGVTPDQLSYDWGLMRASLEDLAARYPDPGYKNLYASFACVARDGAAFRKAMSGLAPHEVHPGVWLKGHSLEACMRWAGT